MKSREKTLVAAIFLFWFSVYTYPSFLSSYAEATLGASSAMTGLIVGSYGFVQMALRIPLGILSDVTRKRKIYVMLGFGASMIASGGLALVAQLAGKVSWNLAALTLVFRGFSGAAAASWVTLTVFYAAHHPPERTGEAMSKIAFPQALSQVAAMLLGATIMSLIGARWAFLLATAAGLVGLFLIARVADIPPEGAPFTLKSFTSVARDKNLIAGSVLAVLFQLISWATVLGFVQNWAKAHVRGFTAAHLGILPVMYLLPNAFVAKYANKISRRYGRGRVLSGGFLLLCAACLLYPLARSLWALFLNQILFGLGMGLILPLTMTAAIETVPGDSRGAAMGIYQAVYGVGMFLGPVIAGNVIEMYAGGGASYAGYAANFRLCALIALVGAVAARLLTRARVKPMISGRDLG